MRAISRKASSEEGGVHVVEIDQMDIGVKALGTVPRRANIGGRGDIDVPVQFGGVTFTPGARLVADEDGVIVLPPGLTESSIQVADAIAATATYAAEPGGVSSRPA